MYRRERWARTDPGTGETTRVWFDVNLATGTVQLTRDGVARLLTKTGFTPAPAPDAPQGDDSPW